MNDRSCISRTLVGTAPFSPYYRVELRFENGSGVACAQISLKRHDCHDRCKVSRCCSNSSSADLCNSSLSLCLCSAIVLAADLSEEERIVIPSKREVRESAGSTL